MKTRRSLSGKDEQGRGFEISPHEEDISTKIVSPPVVRKLRSRVITSDTEDDVNVKHATPQSKRKGCKEKEIKSPPPDSVEVTEATPKVIRSLGLATRTPRPNKRLSAVNLFKIVEEKEEVTVEDCKVKETPAINELEEVLSSAEAITCNNNAAVQKTVLPEKGVVKEEVSMAEGETYDQEYLTTAIKEEDTEKDTEDEYKKENEFIEGEPMVSCSDSDSDDNMPEAKSLSSSKKSINEELSEIASAISLGKKGDHIRRKIDMFKILKAKKEEAAETNDMQGECTKELDVIEDQPMESDSDSDDNMPEAVSFSSSKNTINKELSAIAEAINREKEKKKDRARRKIEMIRIQKAEKEKKRLEKMKLLEISVPKRLPEDVASSLPDKPDIPTIKRPISFDKKRKYEEEEEIEHKVEEKKNKITKFDDYIPLTEVAGSTQFGVVPLEVSARLPKASSQSAAEFKQKALYGSRIKREPSKNLLIYRQKLSAAGKLHKNYRSSNLLKI